MSNQHTPEILERLKRIEELLSALAKVALSATAEAHLSDPKHRTIYENVDRLSYAQLAKKTGFSTGKISGLCQDWERLGLLIKSGNKYRRLL